MKTAAIVALLATGCSLIGVRGLPSPVPKGSDGDCTDSQTLPVTDLVVTGLALSGMTALVIGASRCDGDVCFIWTIPMLPTLAILLPFAASAVDGFDKVGKCRDAKRAAEIAARAPAPRPVALDPSVARKHARVLFMTAARAARSDDCEAARERSPQVFALDAGFHAQVFLADVGIKRCLTPAVSPSIEPTPAQPSPVAPVAP